MHAAALLALVRARHPSDAGAARSLRITRQAFHALRSGAAHPSDETITRACAHLGIDAGRPLAQARADSATDPATRQAWIDILLRLPETPGDRDAERETPAPQETYNTTNDSGDMPADLYYVKSDAIRSPRMPVVAHVELPQRKRAALDLLRWCAAVARLPPDSPRVPYYASRWEVPRKIAAARAAGTFDEITKDAPPIDARHLAAGLAALDECERYAAAMSRPPASCHDRAPPRQSKKPMARSEKPIDRRKRAGSG